MAVCKFLLIIYKYFVAQKACGSAPIFEQYFGAIESGNQNSRN
ncbi:MAG: hypothetical protein JWN83_781 [Chitinophagaceae bacterium]|nr:hypothetical protein [Chitinophagaceae bacterium]